MTFWDDRPTRAELSAEGHDPIVALLKAAYQVRGGNWMNGAPSHVLAELLSTLEVNGWELVRIDRLDEGP